MKRLPPFIILAFAFLLGGCATQLNVAKDSGRFAESLGISANEVLFLGYCYFGKSPKGPELMFVENEGAVVATPTLLYLIREEGQESTEPQQISLRYSDIQTVTHVIQGYGSQVHIESADHIILLEIIRGAFYDPDSSRTLIDLINGKGVRAVEIHNNYEAPCDNAVKQAALDGGRVVEIHNCYEEWYNFEGTGGMSPIILFMGL